MLLASPRSRTMQTFAIILAGTLVALFLFDTWRAVSRSRSLTEPFWRASWSVLISFVGRTRSTPWRQRVLAGYGPVSLIALFLCCAFGLVLGFGVLRWTLDLQLGWQRSLSHHLYLSASSFLTIAPNEASQDPARWLNVVEAALGLSLLGLAIAYIPAVYRAYRRRELRITLLEARAGSPPSAAALLAREGKHPRHLERQLETWERWAAELLRDQSTYPILAYFRARQASRSWLTALVTISDASVLVLLSSDRELRHQAEATFALTSHVLIESAKLLRLPPQSPAEDRLSQATLGHLRRTIAEGGASLDFRLLRQEKVAELRSLYEPCANALAEYLVMPLPSWVSQPSLTEHWRESSQKTAQPKAVASEVAKKPERQTQVDRRWFSS